MSNWYYALDGKIFGPVKVEEIGDLREKGKIDSETLTWNDFKQGEWHPLHSQDALHWTSTAPPPLPLRQINNFWAWSLGLWPVFASILTILLKLALDGNVPAWSCVLLFFIPSTILVRADQMNLTRSGRPRFAKGFFWFIFLVPIYLLRRAMILRQPKTLFFVSILANLTASALIDISDRPDFYFGGGIPLCSSSASIAQIKSIFFNLPKNVNKASIIEVKSMREISSTSEERICGFVADTSEFSTYNGILNIKDTGGGNIYYEIHLKK